MAMAVATAIETATTAPEARTTWLTGGISVSRDGGEDAASTRPIKTSKGSAGQGYRQR